MVGFGEYEDARRRLWAALDGGRPRTRPRDRPRGRGLEGGEEAPLAHPGRLPGAPPPGYAEAASAAAGSVAFAGRLEHEEVGRLVPAADALVFPSTFPEAFGMVAAEAAAAGVLPVSAGHSGAAEVSRALAESLPPEVAELVSFALDDRARARRSPRASTAGWASTAGTRERRARSCAPRRRAALVELGGRRARRARRLGRRARRPPGAGCAALPPAPMRPSVGADPSE